MKSDISDLLVVPSHSTHVHHRIVKDDP